MPDRDAIRRYSEAGNWLAPETTLELLDELDAAEETLDRYEAPARNYAGRPDVEAITWRTVSESDLDALLSWVRRVEVVNADGLTRENAMRESYSARWLQLERSVAALREALTASTEVLIAGCAPMFDSQRFQWYGMADHQAQANQAAQIAQPEQDAP